MIHLCTKSAQFPYIIQFSHPNQLLDGKLSRAGFEYGGMFGKMWTAAPNGALVFNSGNEDDVLALFKGEAGGPVLSGELSKTTFIIANASYSELK